LTVWEHLQFIAYAYDVADHEPKAERLLERLELWDKKDKLAKELSKDMKQKVSLCCGLLPEPDLYFFDEPMSLFLHKRIINTCNAFQFL
jgi:ABC-2 type transport system ATP-binding protein